jgi:hypothetical protein
MNSQVLIGELEEEQTNINSFSGVKCSGLGMVKVTKIIKNRHDMHATFHPSIAGPA